MAPDIPKSKTKNENMLSEIDILRNKNDEAQKTEFTSELFHF